MEMNALHRLILATVKKQGQISMSELVDLVAEKRIEVDVIMASVHDLDYEGKIVYGADHRYRLSNSERTNLER